MTTADLIKIAEELKNTGQYDQDADGTTHCNSFVKAFAKKYDSTYSFPELDGMADAIVDQLAKSDNSLGKWVEIGGGGNPMEAMRQAALAYADSCLVIVGWQKPSHGHVSIVEPEMTTTSSSVFLNQQVPYTAQAGRKNDGLTAPQCKSDTGVEAHYPLSCGYPNQSVDGLRFFAYPRAQATVIKKRLQNRSET